MKNKLLTLSAAACLFLGACVDNGGSFPLPKSTTPTTPGTPTTPTGDYQPFTTGSTWQYRSTDVNPFNPAEVFVNTTNNTMTADLKTFDSIIFHKIKAVTGTDEEEAFFAISNGVYYFHNEGLVNDQGAYDMPYLNESLAAGATFTTAIKPIPGNGPLQYVTTIVEKGITKSILNKSYTNVIHTKVELQNKDTGVWQTGGTFEYYVAKNIGLIMLSATTQGVELSKVELMSYTIK